MLVLSLAISGCQKKEPEYEGKSVSMAEIEAKVKKKIASALEKDNESDSGKFCTVEIITPHGTFTTDKEVNMDTTLSTTLSDGKRLWVGQGWIVKEK